jgi:glycerate 2-kinase
MASNVLKAMLSSAAIKDNLLKVFLHSVKAVSPEELILKRISRHENAITVQNKQYFLKKNVFMVGKRHINYTPILKYLYICKLGFGKAVLRMAAAAIPLLEGHLKGGVLSVPVGSDVEMVNQLRRNSIEVVEGAKDNMPDQQSLQAAEKIKSLVSALSPEHILLVLISGNKLLNCNVYNYLTV